MIFNMSTGGASTADKVKYNNTESGLQSTDVQGAIDEVNSSLEEVNEKLMKIINSYLTKTYKQTYVPNTDGTVTFYFEKSFTSVDDYDFSYDMGDVPSNQLRSVTPTKYIDRIELFYTTAYNTSITYTASVTISIKI